MRQTVRYFAVLCAAFLGCSGEPEQQSEADVMDAPTTTDAAPRVRIVEPAADATLRGSTVRVVLEAEGIRIVPAGEPTPGTGHHHLFLDADVGEPGTTIPAGQEGIIHLGQAQTEFDLTDVTPGEHRLIAVAGDGLHRIFDPMVADTVHFVIEGG